MVVEIAGHPGTWQIAAQSPQLRLWWAMPWSDDARADPAIEYGHIKAHVVDIKHPTYTPGVVVITLQISHNGKVRERVFANREEAAKFGVAYYLTDNGYATRSKAKTAADKVRRGEAAQVESDHGTFTFQEAS